MIISHKFNFVFIKTKKTASTSIEIGLSKFCGPDDIITPISPEDELLRYRLNEVTAQNFCSDSQMARRYRELVVNQDLEQLRGEWTELTSGLTLYNHLPYRDIPRDLRDRIETGYTIITSERDPHDRLQSFIRYRLSHRPVKELNRVALMAYIFAIAPRKSYRNAWLYHHKSSCKADILIRYHNLESDLSFLRNELQLPEKICVPITKKTSTKAVAGKRRLSRIEAFWIDVWTRAETKAINAAPHLRSLRV